MKASFKTTFLSLLNDYPRLNHFFKQKVSLDYVFNKCYSLIEDSFKDGDYKKKGI